MPGELAAVAVAVLWSFTSLQFSAAAERIGSLALNAIRITIALGLIAAAHAVFYGGLWIDLSRDQLLLLSVSGLIGLVLGDFFYFRALMLVGPKRGALMMTLWPAIAAAVAWLWLGETVGPWALAGMSVTLLGIAGSIAGRRKPVEPESRGRLALGLFFGALAALGQALGFVMAKKGMTRGDELFGSMVRMAAAALAVWPMAVMGRAKLGEALRNRAAIGFAAGGAFTGPFLGVWLSLYAVMHSTLGISSTIMATTPVLLIPLAAIFRRERPTALEIAGAVVAVAGVALLLNAPKAA